MRCQCFCSFCSSASIREKAPRNLAHRTKAISSIDRPRQHVRRKSHASTCMLKAMAASSATHLTPVADNTVALTDSLDGSLLVPTTNDEPRNSGSLSLFSNLWSNNSSSVSLHRRESVDSGSAAVNFSAGLSQLSASSFLPRSRHRATKSTSSRVSISSQPVLVRAYTAGDRSRTPSVAPTPRPGNAMRSDASLPPVEAFTFDGILRAVEPDIQGAIDGIAEIYARSRLSLANEHDSHMPPLGEITSPRIRQSGLAIRTAGLERTLTTVAEASSSSERLAGESRAGSTTSGNGKMTAYGSLRSIISRGKSPEGSPPSESLTANRMLPSDWTMHEDGRPSILLKTHSSASHQVTLDAVAELRATSAAVEITPRYTTSAGSPPTSPSLWLPWRRVRAPSSASQTPGSANAEMSLKKVLYSKSSTLNNAGRN
jgi:hypothetical protein